MPFIFAKKILALNPVLLTFSTPLFETGKCRTAKCRSPFLKNGPFLTPIFSRKNFPSKTPNFWEKILRISTVLYEKVSENEVLRQNHCKNELHSYFEWVLTPKTRDSLTFWSLNSKIFFKFSNLNKFFSFPKFNFESSIYHPLIELGGIS